MNKKVIKTALYIIIFMLIGSGIIYIGFQGYINKKTEKIMKYYKSTFVNTSNIISVDSTTIEPEDNSGSMDVELRKFDWEGLHKRNIYSWVYIPDSYIDFPVICGSDNAYYLNHDYDGNYFLNGSIFLDSKYYNKPEEAYKDFNVLIYGHNMGSWTTTCFSTLAKYKDENHLKKHKYIYIYTEHTLYLYRIISFKDTNNNDSAYKDIVFEEDFDEWYEEQLNESMYQIKSNAAYLGKECLTLSTCTNIGSNKYVLTGRKVLEINQ